MVMLGLVNFSFVPEGCFMNARPSRHMIALLVTVAALSLLALPAFIVPPTKTVSRAVASELANRELNGSVDRKREPAKLPLSCQLQPIRTEYVVGELPEMSVRITNVSEGKLVLVGSLDASDLRWRYPHCYYEIEGPPGSETHGMPRCGMVNPLRAQDFVTVAPGAEFDPNAKVDDYGFFATNFNWRSFSVPGTYRLTYVYSTASDSSAEWVGDGEMGELRKLVDQVPRGVARSNTVELKFAPPPDGYVPHTNFPLNHSESQNQGGWFVFKLVSGGPIKPIRQRLILLFDGLPDGVTGEQASLEFANTFSDLRNDVSTLLKANPEMSRPTMLVSLTPEPKVLAEVSIDKFAAVESHFKALPATVVSRDVLLRSVVEVASNDDHKEESVVVLVFTEHAFDAEDIAGIRRAGDEKQNISVVRVTRRNGSWIPERVTGK